MEQWAGLARGHSTRLLARACIPIYFDGPWAPNFLPVTVDGSRKHIGWLIH